jgi:sterol desaturase/sphingolipid hydroxylase (fatty acid hydroxylase superfamily)
MAFEDLVPILIAATFLALLVVERLFPAREQPHVKRWLAKGLGFFAVIFVMNGLLPALALAAIGDYTVLHLQALGTFGGAALMLVVADLVGYWIHRGEHSSELVWRWTHQMHHAAERMDMAGSAFFHPLDFLLQQVVPSVFIVVLLGVTPMAAAVGGFVGFFLGVAPHLNVRTPAWLGYVFQRPEMHAVHHQRGVHAYNYGVLAFSDLLFGTWRNPAEFPAGEFGFWDGASSQLSQMLLGRDVTRGPSSVQTGRQTSPSAA